MNFSYFFKRFIGSRQGIVTLVFLLLAPALAIVFVLTGFSGSSTATQNIPVAIVNADAGYQTGDSTVNSGDELVKTLTDSGQFDWKEVSAADAQQGVESGKYYFAVTISKDYSKDLASGAAFLTATKGNQEAATPASALLTVDYNDSNNYLATEMGENVLKDLQQSIAVTTSTQDASAMLVALNAMGSGIRTAGAGVTKLSDASSQLDTAMGAYATGVDELSGGSVQLASGVMKLSDAFPLMATSVNALSAGGDQLSQGMGQLSQGMPRLEQTVASFADEADRLQTGLTSLSAGISGSENSVNSTVGDLKTDTAVLATNLKDFASQTANGSAALKTQVKDVISQSSQGVSSNAAKIFNQQLITLCADNADSAGNAGNATGLSCDEAGVSQWTAAECAQLEPSNQAQCETVISLRGQVLDSIAASAGKLGDQVDTQIDQNYANAVVAPVNQLSAGVQSVDIGLGALQSMTASDCAVGGNGGSTGAGGDAGNGADTVPGMTMCTATVEVPQLDSGGHPQLDAQGNLVTTTQSVPNIGGIVSQLADSDGGISHSVSSFSDSAQQLGTAVNGLAKLSQLFSQGLDSFATQSGQLAASSEALTKGASSFVAGVKGLGQGAQALHAGTSGLSEGIGALAEGLEQSGGSIPDMTTQQLTSSASTIAQPVTLDENYIHQSANDAQGYAPFVIILLLLFGILMAWEFFAPIPARFLGGHQRSATSVLRGLQPVLVIAIVQSLLAFAGLIALGSFWPDNPAGTLGFIVLVAVAFAVVFQFLLLACGRVWGSIISVLLIFVQIVASGGIVPQESTSMLLRVLNPLLPGTYGADGLRLLMTGAGGDWAGLDSRLWAALIYFVALTIVAFLGSLWLGRMKKIFTLGGLMPAVSFAQ
jgi:putative membrane protein